MPPDQLPVDNSPEFEALLLQNDENAQVNQNQLDSLLMQGEEGNSELKSINQTIKEDSDKVKKVQIVPSNDENELATTFFKMLRGPKGEDGYTPEKGKDYYTKEEIAEVVKEIQDSIRIPEDGLDGYTPVRGEDYFTDEDISSMVDDVFSRIPTPKDGKDAEVDYEMIISECIARIPKPKNGKNGKNSAEMTSEQILDKIRGLLSYNDLKDLPTLWKNVASRDYDLVELKDVSVTSPTNGQVLKYNSTSRKWENGTDNNSPGGSDTQVQFNDGGSFGGDAGLTYNKTTDTLTVGTGAGIVVTHSLKSDHSDGVLIEANNGTDIGILGAGNTANATWYGSHNYSTATQDTIAAFTGVGKTLGSLSTATYPSLTELSYVKGVTSAIQTQIDGKQASDATLTALAAYNTNGLLTQTAADTFVGRTLTGTANQITVTNGDGVAGNPTLSLPSDVLIPTVLTVPNSGLHLLDTDASHDLIIKPGSDLTADRILTITTGDSARTLTLTGDASISGTNTGDQTSVSGNAGTATALQTPRTIGGVSFDGTANITVATATGGFTVSGGNLALGTNSITMTGSIGATGARVTKGWFTDLESTNMPTVGGVAMLTISSTDTLTNKTLTSPKINENVALTTTATKLNYLTSATGTTGTTSTNIVFSTSPVLTSPTFTTSLNPTTDDGAGIGDATHRVSDIFLAEGAVLNWDNGDLTLTQTNNELALGGGNLDIGTNILRIAGDFDIDGTPAADDTFVGPSTDEFNAGATIAQWDVVYMGSGGKWLLTDADAAASSGGMLAMATAAGTDTNALKVALPGTFVRNDAWNWTPGATLYLDTATAGNIVATAPSGTDDVVRVVGFAMTADIIYFFPSPDYITIV